MSIRPVNARKIGDSNLENTESTINNLLKNFDHILQELVNYGCNENRLKQRFNDFLNSIMQEGNKK